MKTDKALILNSIKEYLKFKNDKDFATFLGIKQNTLSSWKSRGVIDYDLIIAKCDFIDANWLITGTGEMLKESRQILKDTSVVSEPPYKYEDSDIGDINLSGLEQASKDELINIIRRLLEINNRDSITIERMVDVADRNSITLSRLVDILYNEEEIKRGNSEFGSNVG